MKGLRNGLGRLLGLAILTLATLSSLSRVATAADLPVVNVYPNDIIISEPRGSGSFLIVKGTTDPLVVHFEMIGTATLGLDYQINLTNYLATITPGTNSDFTAATGSTYTNSFIVSVMAIDDPDIEPDESIILRLLPDPAYQIGDASLAAIRLHSNPPPWVWLDFRDQNIQQIDPTAVFPIGGPVSPNVTSVWVYVDDKLLATKSLTPSSSGGSFSIPWINPQPGSHEISAVVKDVHGAAVRTAQSVHVVDAFLKPEAIARTLDGATIVPYTGVTTFDSSGRAGVFVEFAIPAFAMNYNALLYIDQWGPGIPEDLYAYPGDGAIGTNDLSAEFEFIGLIGQLFGSPPQVDVAPWVHRFAGSHLGFKLRVDPNPTPITQANGDDAGHLGNFRIILFAPGTDVPGRLQWLNFELNHAQWSDQPLNINLETFDPDSRIKSFQVTAKESYGQASQVLKLDVDLPPGTNNVSILFTNTVPGQKDFSIQMQSESETITRNFGSITFYSHPTNSPAHRWLATDAEGSSYYVVDAAGRAWVWGYNSVGQLGLGFKASDVIRPTMLAPPPGKKWRQFTYNTHSAVGVTDDGATYAMGSYNFTGTLMESVTPQLLFFPPSGFAQRAALTQTGLWVVNVSDDLTQISGPTPGANFTQNVAEIDGSNTQILALRKDGTLDPAPSTYNGAALPWVAISVTATYSLGIDSQGQMWAWGENSAGQMPIRGVTYSDIPLKAAAPPGGGTWTKICAGNTVSLAVDSSGRLFAWGRQGYTGAPRYSVSTPNLVEVPSDEIGWLDLSVGGVAALALSARGNLYMWTHDTKPQKVEGLPPLLEENATATYATFEPTSVSLSTDFAFDLLTSQSSNPTLEISSDLLHWTTLSNLVTQPGKTHVTLPRVQSGNNFIRVHSQP